MTPIDNIKKLIPKINAAKEDVAHLASNMSPSLYRTLWQKENEHVLQTLEELFNSFNDPLNYTTSDIDQQQKDLQDRLEDLLTTRWDYLQHLFPYTHFPNTKVTELCLDIATLLHQWNPTKSIYRYLMPSILYENDQMKILEFENVNEYPLSHFVLGENNESLLPYISIISENLDPKNGIDIEKIPNFYNAVSLSDAEKNRIWHASPLAHLIFILQQEIENKKSNNSLGHQLTQLKNAFRKATATTGGQQYDAGPFASIAAVDFIENHWNKHPEAYQNKIKNTIGEIDEIIKILQYPPMDSASTCVATLARRIEEILSNNQSLYENLSCLKKTKDLLNQLEKNYVSSKHPSVSSALDALNALNFSNLSIYLKQCIADLNMNLNDDPNQQLLLAQLKNCYNELKTLDELNDTFDEIKKHFNDHTRILTLLKQSSEKNKLLSDCIEKFYENTYLSEKNSWHASYHELPVVALQNLLNVLKIRDETNLLYDKKILEIFISLTEEATPHELTSLYQCFQPLSIKSSQDLLSILEKLQYADCPTQTVSHLISNLFLEKQELPQEHSTPPIFEFSDWSCEKWIQILTILQYNNDDMFDKVYTVLKDSLLYSQENWTSALYMQAIAACQRNSFIQNQFLDQAQIFLHVSSRVETWYTLLNELNHDDPKLETAFIESTARYIIDESNTQFILPISLLNIILRPLNNLLIKQKITSAYVRRQFNLDHTALTDTLMTLLTQLNNSQLLHASNHSQENHLEKIALNAEGLSPETILASLLDQFNDENPAQETIVELYAKAPFYTFTNENVEEEIQHLIITSNRLEHTPKLQKTLLSTYFKKLIDQKNNFIFSENLNAIFKTIFSELKDKKKLNIVLIFQIIPLLKSHDKNSQEIFLSHYQAFLSSLFDFNLLNIFLDDKHTTPKSVLFESYQTLITTWSKKNQHFKIILDCPWFEDDEICVLISNIAENFSNVPSDLSLETCADIIEQLKNNLNSKTEFLQYLSKARNEIIDDLNIIIKLDQYIEKIKNAPARKQGFFEGCSLSNTKKIEIAKEFKYAIKKNNRIPQRDTSFYDHELKKLFTEYFTQKERSAPSPNNNTWFRSSII